MLRLATAARAALVFVTEPVHKRVHVHPAEYALHWSSLRSQGRSLSKLVSPVSSMRFSSVAALFFVGKVFAIPGAWFSEAGIRVRVYRTDVPASSGLGGQQQVENDLPNRRQPAYYRIMPPGRTRSLERRGRFPGAGHCAWPVRAIPNHRASPLHRSTGVLCARASLKWAALASGSVPKAIIPVWRSPDPVPALEC